LLVNDVPVVDRVKLETTAVSVDDPVPILPVDDPAELTTKVA
jgi:hypothetical protein